MNVQPQNIISPGAQEVWELIKANNELIKANNLEIKAESKAMSLEWDKKFTAMKQESDKSFRRTSREIHRLERLFEGQWGKLMESLAEGGILKVFREKGIDVDEIYPRAKRRKDGDTMEIDILLADNVDIVLVEVKTTLKSDHVKHFIEKLEKFHHFFKRYRGMTTYGAVAALRIEQAADQFASKRGLFVVKVGGDGMTQIINNKDFKPKTFSYAAC